MVKNLMCLAALAMAVVLAAACERAEEERRPDTGTPQEQPPVSERQEDEGGIQWAGTYDNALKLARESNKPVMAITVAPDNEDSRAIENELLTNARVRELSQQFINVRLESTKDAELPEEVRNPGEIVFLGSDGKKMDSYKGRDAEALAEKMEEVLKKHSERKDQGFAQPMQDDRPLPDEEPQQPQPPSPQPPPQQPPAEQDQVGTQSTSWVCMDHSEAMKLAKDQNKKMLHIEIAAAERPMDQPRQMQGQDEPQPGQEPGMPPAEQEHDQDLSKLDKNSIEYVTQVILRDERVVKFLPEYVVMIVEKPMDAQAVEKKEEAQAVDVRRIRFVIADADGNEIKAVEEVSADALAKCLEEISASQQEPGPKPEEPKAEPKEKVWVMMPWNEAMTRAKDQNKKILLFVVQPGDAGFQAFHKEVRKDEALMDKMNEYVAVKVYGAKDLAGLPAEVKDRAAGRSAILILDADGKVMDTIDVNIDSFRSKLGVQKMQGDPEQDQEKDQPKDQERTQEPKPQPPSEETILWVMNKDEGLKRAKEENKPVMIVYLKEGDESTDRLMNTAFADQRVIELSRQFVVVRQPLKEGHDHKADTPHVHFVSADDEELASLDHIETTEKLLDVMRQALEKSGQKKS